MRAGSRQGLLPGAPTDPDLRDIIIATCWSRCKGLRRGLEPKIRAVPFSCFALREHAFLPSAISFVCSASPRIDLFFVALLPPVTPRRHRLQLLRAVGS